MTFPPSFADRPSRGPRPQENSETQPSLLLSRLSRPRSPALRLAAGGGHSRGPSIKSGFVFPIRYTGCCGLCNLEGTRS